jgi:hypothetical protein
MAKRIVQSTQVKLGGTLYSAQIKSAGLDVDAPEVDVTNMDSDGWAELLGGIKKGTLAIEMVLDGDDSGFQAYLWGVLGTVVTFSIQGTDASTSTSNALFSGSVLITKATPVRGAVGDAHGASYSFPTSGAITRATA